MEATRAKETSSVSSPLSFTNVGGLLKKKILAWSQETGLPASVRVRVGDKIFDLHKYPLLSKSGFFKRLLANLMELDIPNDFPGGSEAFEMIALFSYGSSPLIDPFNVAALRCAAEFLEMTEDHGSGNLCERADLYLNQVVLQSWDDTLIVLQKCQTLNPWAEDLLIVSRCLEALAFMACMEILDPEQRRDRPVSTLQALTGRLWNCETVKEIAAQDLWIKDLIALPFGFFNRIIGSLRRQGMKEKYVSPIIVFYANKWVLSKKTHQFWENTAVANSKHDADNKVSFILQGIIELLHTRESSKVIPVGFYFALLSRSLNLTLSNDSNIKLQDQIASLLHLAQVDHFLLPERETECIASSVELSMMARIVSIGTSSNSETGNITSNRNSVIGELWDSYLSRIAVDPKLEPRRFMELIEIVPISDRLTHDHLYRAMNTFLTEHPDISQEEKSYVCKHIDCQKLSQETCIHAVQNEMMPLRLIVQALFVQQLNTHQAFKNCAESIKYTNCVESSGSLSGSRYQQPKNQKTPVESPYKEAYFGETVGRPLGFLIQQEIAKQRSEVTKEDYESTSFRLQSLEQELISLKTNLRWENISKGTEKAPTKTHSFRMFSLEGREVGNKMGNPLGQVSSCIDSVNWASQRRYASRLLKVFRRLTIFRQGKPKRKQAGSGCSDGPTHCKRIQHMHEMYDC